MTSYATSGTVGAEVAAYPCAFGACAGNLTLSSITAGATIEQAYLYANNYFGAPNASATFGGNALGAIAGYATDLGFTSYRWDVTSLVTGNGVYAASYAGPTNTYGLALAVVYSHPSLPAAQVLVNDGAIDTGAAGGSFSTQFNAAAGAGGLWVHTVADNAQGQSGETVDFNGAQVNAGPIDANLGLYASLVFSPVTTVAGLNTATINVPQNDQFGWDLAVLYAEGGSTPTVPEPATLGLLGLGLAGIRFLGRGRKAR
jgi:hypothetical protein